MNNSGIFNLNRTAILAGIISASFSLHVMASAGKVEFALGGANLLRNDGSSQQISKGDEINPGDTIKTTNGRVQVRFTDGGYMSLQPNTEFKVEDYSYSGKTDGTEKAFFRLIEGGLRAITGVVGHANKPNYKVSTPVATIGIRGSEYLAEYRGSLRAHCNHGSIYVFNDKGNLILFRGQTAVVGNGAPSYGDNIEGVGARGPSNTNTAYNQENNDNSLGNLFRVGDVRNPDGSLAALDAVGNTIVAYANATYYAGEGGGYAYDDYHLSEVVDNGSYTNTTTNIVSLDGSGNLVNIETKSTIVSNSGGLFSEVNTTTTTPDAGAQTLDKNSYGALSWLRISGSVTETNVTKTVDSSGNVSLSGPYSNSYDNPHYIFGTQTSIADLAGLGSFQASYALVGGTTPTDSLGNTGSLTSGYFVADFGNQQFNGGLTVNMPTGSASGNYIASFGGGLNGGASFNNHGSGGYSSVSGASVSVSGFFAGANAAQVGLSYVISPSSGNDIAGVAGFNKTGQSPSNPP